MYAQLGQTFRELGPSDTMLYACKRAMERARGDTVLHKYLLVAQRVPAAPLTRARPGRKVTVRQVSESEYQVAWFPRPAEMIAPRFRQGAQCFVAFRGPEPVGCLWLATGTYEEDEVRCTFVLQPPERLAWDFDVYVAQAHRGGRVFAYLWDAAFSWLREGGYDYTASRIDAFNAASVRSHARMGAKVIGSAVFVHLPRHQVLLSSVKPRLRLTHSAAPPPCMVITAPAVGGRT